ETFGKQLPIHFIITKCDLIPGFKEFFSESSTDEISQNFGITIPSLMANENIHEVFNERFNALIKRLNKHLITRLHQERNIFARPYIKDFPLHIEHLKEHIAQLIKSLQQAKLPLRSVHLTSAAQPVEDMHATIIDTDDTTRSLSILGTPPVQERAYFIRQFLLHTMLAITPSISSKNSTRDLWPRRITYAISVTLILTAAIILGQDFKHSIDATYAIQNHLSEYQSTLKQNQQGAYLTKEALNLLNVLQKSEEEASHSIFYSKQAIQASTKLYHEALQAIVLPQIKNYLEKDLRNAQNKKAENIYPILKAYIMLNDKNHFDPNFIAKTLTQLAPNTVDKKTIFALTQHVKTALRNQVYVKLDTNLIWQIRKEFYRLPKTELAFILLKNMDDNNIDKSIELGTHLSHMPVLMSKALEPQIPAMYTEKSFQKIISHEINQAIDEIYEGNWILGNNPIEPTDEEIIALTTEVHTQYIEKYVDIWESLLANIEIRTPQNLREMDTMLSTLTSHQSPLLQLLHTIRQNTNFAPILDASPKLQKLGVLLTDTNNNGLYDIFVSLQKLHNELQVMLQANNAQGAIFAATVKRTQSIPENDTLARLRTISESSPEPLKSWLVMIAKNTWQQMLLETAQFIENKYQKDVMGTYRTQIQNHFPFNPSSLLEVDLTQFTHFFGNPGQLGQFHQTYLKPFLDESQKTWMMTDNQKLPLNDAILSQIERGMHLQHAFFPNGDNKLYVTFSLQPVSLDKSIKGLTLNINGQEIHYENNHEQTSHLLTWPGNHALHETKLNFVGQNNQLYSRAYQGNWGWFKLVNTSTENVRSKKELLLSFDIDGYSAKYILFTEGKLNPFLPMNISHFELLPHLVG
ncbi:MAG TPA: ImcF-related family protein, partial [Gammaproteobacteria bacterium]|nr:ImcF-related family protein [Gammaproteobacteria bacterium]